MLGRDEQAIDVFKLYKECLFFQGRGQPVTMDPNAIKQLILAAIPREQQLEFLTKVNDVEFIKTFKEKYGD